MSITVDVRLAVEVGAARVKAALGWPDGTVQAVTFDGVAWLHAEVFLDHDGRVLAGPAAQRAAAADLGRLVAPVPALTRDTLQVGDTVADPADLVAALVDAVVDRVREVAGGLPSTVVTVVPAAWGPRRTRALREILTGAGLPQPDTVEAPLAVGRYLLALGTPVPAGTAVLVCNAGADFEAGLLRRTPSGFEAITRIVARDGGGTALDLALADALDPTDPSGGRDSDTAGVGDGAGVAVRAARTAREALSFATSVPVLPPGPGPAVVLSVARLREVTAPVVARAVDAARVAVDAADLPAGTVLWVVVAGGGARSPLLANPLRDTLGVPAWMVTDPDLAAVYGALHTPATATAEVRRPVDADRWGDIGTVIAAALAAILLYAQFTAGAQRYETGTVLAHWGGLGAASVLAALACVVGTALTTAGRHIGHPDTVRRHRLTGMALAAGGIAGLVVAVVAGTITAGAFDEPPQQFLTWTVLPVLPLALAAATTGGVMVWRPDPPPEGWITWLRFPTLAVVLAGLGELLIGYDLTDTPGLLEPAGRQLDRWTSHTGVLAPISTIGQVGAFAVGAAISLLLVSRWTHRAMVAPLLGLLVAVTLTTAGTSILSAGLAAATAGWWLWRALYIPLRPLILQNHPPAPATGAAPPAADHGGRP